jgi:hypothetical protein
LLVQLIKATNTPDGNEYGNSNNENENDNGNGELDLLSEILARDLPSLIAIAATDPVAAVSHAYEFAPFKGAQLEVLRNLLREGDMGFIEKIFLRLWKSVRSCAPSPHLVTSTSTSIGASIGISSPSVGLHAGMGAGVAGGAGAGTGAVVSGGTSNTLNPMRGTPSAAPLEHIDWYGRYCGHPSSSSSTSGATHNGVNSASAYARRGSRYAVSRGDPFSQNAAGSGSGAGTIVPVCPITVLGGDIQVTDGGYAAIFHSL